MGSHVLTQAISHKVSPGLLPAWIAKHQLSRQDPCRMATALPGPESTTCFFLSYRTFYSGDQIIYQVRVNCLPIRAANL